MLPRFISLSLSPHGHQVSLPKLWSSIHWRGLFGLCHVDYVQSKYLSVSICVKSKFKRWEWRPFLLPGLPFIAPETRHLCLAPIQVDGCRTCEGQDGDHDHQQQNQNWTWTRSAQTGPPPQGWWGMMRQWGMRWHDWEVESIWLTSSTSHTSLVLSGSIWYFACS